ncbi:MAG: phosphomannomutase [Myxococcota bacterium]|jgi:phosphomannomutase
MNAPIPMEEIRRRAQAWMASDPDSYMASAVAAQLQMNHEPELRRCFTSRLKFGTAGIRGLIGPGPGNMNQALIRLVTTGLARYLLDTVPDAATRGVVVGHDARQGSELYARETAMVLSGAGIRVIFCRPLAPTPLVAFGVKHLGAAAGVVITASHNPPDYNGYKVYWENGAQIIPPHDTGISAAIDAVADTALSAPNLGNTTIFEAPASLEQDYLTAIADQLAHVEIQAADEAISTVYTPLHGVGAPLYEAAMEQEGLAYFTVPEQREPDGAFPTVAFPNPEEKGALDMSLALAHSKGSALIMANDPDADRLALVVRADGKLRPLSGDETGAVFGDALLEALGRERIASEKAFVARSMVSAELLDAVATHHGATCFETLTGFKWLWNTALARIAKGERFVFAYEEALGHSVGPAVHDKDGIGAAILAARIARSSRGIYSRLCEIFERHGYLGTRQQSIVDASPGGIERHGRRMDAMRIEPPTSVAGIEVARTRDFGVGGELPQTNCVAWWLSDGTRIMLRPSGTEPKLKVYVQLTEPWSDGARSRAEARLDALHASVLKFIEPLG